MHIGLFGGTFDPPHLGHSMVAEEILAQGILDQVWFVPVFEHPWAERLQKKFAAYEHRVAMINLILGDNQFVKHFRQKSYTFDTLEFFSQKHPKHRFSWIMGSEYLPKFDDFLAVHPGLSNYDFFVYPRAGFAREPIYQNMTLLDSVPEVKISSTQIRERVLAGQSVVKLVGKKIARYINQNNLYQTS